MLKKHALVIIAYSLFWLNNSIAQNISDHFPPIEIIESNCPSAGHFFISSSELIDNSDSNYIAIIDNTGIPVFFKVLNNSANNFSVQPSGQLSYFSYETDGWHIMDSSYNEIDTIYMESYIINDADFIHTKNNNSIVLGFEERFHDMSIIISGGNSNATIQESIIQILDSDKNIILNWNSKNYFNINDANENSPFLDLTESVIDYISLTDLEVDSDTSLLLCCRYLDEITKIDSRNGSIIWRLGGKNNEFSFINDDLRFTHPTSLFITEDGLLKVFDSGILNNSGKPSIVTYELNEELKTANLISRIELSYTDNQSDSAGFIKSGNNHVVYWGDNSPSITEYNPNGTVALEVDYSNHSISKKLHKQEWKTNLFTPVVDTINFGMWDYTVYKYILILKNNSSSDITITNIENSSEAYYTNQTVPFVIPANGTTNLMINYFPETIPIGIVKDVFVLNADTETQRISQQVFMIGYRDDFIDPTVEYSPSNGSTDITIDTNITIKFSEPLRMGDNSEIEYSNINSLIDFKETDINGINVEFNAVINSEKDQIKLFPKDKLKESTTYYLNINNTLEDYYNNTLTTSSISFSTRNSTNVDKLNFITNIYPNPSTGNIIVKFNPSKYKELIIFDINGVVLLKYNISKYEKEKALSLIKYTNGIYKIGLVDYNGIIHSKPIIISK